MYKDFFNFTEPPFAIVPNPKFFFLSERHKEALSHMLSGISGGGGMALLTGEVGTGKTMTMRALLARLPTESQVLTIVNPSINEIELLQTICDGFELSYKDTDSFKTLLDLITNRLYENEARHIDSILLIDEAQHLKPEVLELLRLLTNIETANYKLLKVILIGQPELHQVLQKENLRQLAQRITERYQLMPLPEDELKQYILHRLTCVDRLDPLFHDACYRVFSTHTGGIPRLINLVCDQALKLAYREGKRYITADIAKQACRHILDWQTPEDKLPAKKSEQYKPYYIGGAIALGAVVSVFALSALFRAIFYDKVPEQVASLEPEPVVIAQPKIEPAPVEIPKSEPASSVMPEIQTLTLSNLTMQRYSMGNAIQDLYQQWGYIADEQASSCRAQTRADLSCYRGIIGLEQLANINRPAVLVMNAPDGRFWYTQLYAVGDKHVELVIGRDKQRIAVSKSFIEQHWSGDSILLWRPPFGNTGMLSMGQNNARVSWLDDRLNLALGEFDEPKRRFDQYVKNKVIAFQVQQGIDADGIAGPLTIMTLDGVLGLAGPTLHNSHSLSEQEVSYINEGQIVLKSERVIYQNMLLPLPEFSLAIAPETALSTQVAQIEKAIEKVASKPATKHQVVEKTKPIQSPNTISANSTKLAIGDEVVNISELDFSSFSPDLAQKAQAVLKQVAKNKEQTDFSIPENQSYSNVVKIADLPATILARLPDMDFQAHVYATNPEDRWIKVNNQNITEGEKIAGKVLLRGVEPQQIVVQFENRLIAIPALSTW